MNKKKSSIVTTLFGNDKNVYLTPNKQQTSKSDKKLNSISFYDVDTNKNRTNKEKENNV